jgi:adsorption protein B
MFDLVWFLAIVYLIGGLNDLFLDLVFYLGPLRRMLSQGRENPRCDEWELHAEPEKPIAILIPAWDESSVIGAMLDSTCDRLDYANYDIFVGTYPNDEATQFEVARAAFNRPRIHRVVCPNPGPTSKADCLNWVVEAIKLNEIETGKRYEIFVLQDAEDVVHPLTLKVFNRFIPDYDLIQVPVIPYERELHKITGNTYLDEFAENHLKGLVSRLAVGGMVPSAGVGTGFSRAACDELAEQTNHVLFPPVSLTEDYDFSFRLFRNQRKSGLAEVWVDRTDARGRHVKELVAIREFFPANFSDSIRQKQRWLLGITFQGAQKLGWGSGLRERYMLLRDRIGVATSLLNVLAAFVFFRIGELILEALVHDQSWNALLSAPAHPHWLDLIIDLNLCLLANRIFQRGAFVARVARRRQILMTPVRMLWGNVIDFYCAFHAVRRFTHSQYTGKPLKWLKTTHEYPNVETLLRRHRPLGDILLERRLITPEQLRYSLAIQNRPEFRKVLLGEILVALPAITDQQLFEALSLQNRAKATLTAPIDLDSEDIPLNINQLVASQIPASPNGTVTAPSPFPSQLTAAAPPPGPTTLRSFYDEKTALANDSNPILADPVARSSRHIPPASPSGERPAGRLYTFAGAASRRRPAPNRLRFDPPTQPADLLPFPRESEESASRVSAPTANTDEHLSGRLTLTDPPPATAGSPTLAELAWDQPSAEPEAPDPAPATPDPNTLRPLTPGPNSKFRMLNPFRESVLIAPELTPRPRFQAPTAITRVISPRSIAPTSYRRTIMLHSAGTDWKPSTPKRYAVVIGTRPEAIKLAPVIAELRARAAAEKRPDDVFVCTTGQHQDLVLEPLSLFGIVPDLDLGLMEPNQTLAAIGARVLQSFAEVIAILQPEWVIVQGDTATTAMAAMAAFYAGVKVAHVEAGLRTYDLKNPFPEEANRRMVGIVASMHFAATEAAKKNLVREGVLESAIRVTGNTGIDALQLHCNRIGLPLVSPRRVLNAETGEESEAQTLNPIRVLVTAHRRENLESGIHDICQAIKDLTKAHPDRFHFVWPLHPNPRVSDLASRYLTGVRDVTLIPAVGYDRLLSLISQCDLVVTDSGGLQEEAPSFGKPVLILRQATERPEGVWAGVARLVGTDSAQIFTAVEELSAQIEADFARRRELDIPPAAPANPYGDGFASARIADFFAGLPVHEFGYTAPTPSRIRSFPPRGASGSRPAAQAIN